VSALAVGACLAVGIGSGLARAATPPDPLKNWSLAQIEAVTAGNAAQASSVTLTGTVCHSGQTFTVKIGIKKGRGFIVTVAGSKIGTDRLLVIGKNVYLHLDDKVLTRVGGSTLSTQIHGRYLHVSSDSLVSSLPSLPSSLPSLAGTLPSLVSSLPSLASALPSLATIQQHFDLSSSKVTFSKGKVSTLDGVRVLELKDSAGIDVYVTDSSKPEIFAVTAPEDGVTVRVNVGAPVALDVPLASDVVNGAAFGL
jgi:hypothetical protein